MSTKCDIIRDTSNAMSCGLCTSKTRPMGCGNIPEAVCSVPGAANAKLQLFALEHKFNRSNIMLPEEKVYNMKVRLSKEALAAAYPAVSDTDISWPDFELCKQSSDGLTTSPAYFNRADLVEMGMNPIYPIGGKTAENLFWKFDKSPVPVIVDYIMNPQLFVIVIFVFLVFVYTIMILSVRYRLAIKKRQETYSAAYGNAYGNTYGNAYTSPQYTPQYVAQYAPQYAAQYTPPLYN